MNPAGQFDDFSVSGDDDILADKSETWTEDDLNSFELHGLEIYSKYFNNGGSPRDLSWNPLDPWTRGAISAIRRGLDIVDLSRLTTKNLLQTVRTFRLWRTEAPPREFQPRHELSPDQSYARARSLCGYLDLRSQIIVRSCDDSFEPYTECRVCAKKGGTHDKSHIARNLDEISRDTSNVERYLHDMIIELPYWSPEIDTLLSTTPEIYQGKPARRRGVFPFLQLPQELQILILKFSIIGSDVSRSDFAQADIFDSLKPLMTSMSGSRTADWKRSYIPPTQYFEHYEILTTMPIFQVNRHIRSESFDLALQFPLKFKSLKALCWFLSTIGPRGRSQVRHVKLRDTRLFKNYTCGNLSDTLELLSTCQRLEYLELSLIHDNSYGDISKNLAHMKTEPRHMKRPEEPLRHFNDLLAIEPLQQLRGLKDVYFDLSDFKIIGERSLPLPLRNLVSMTSTLENMWKQPRQDDGKIAAWRRLRKPADLTWAELEHTFNPREREDLDSDASSLVSWDNSESSVSSSEDSEDEDSEEEGFQSDSDRSG